MKKNFRCSLKNIISLIFILNIICTSFAAEQKKLTLGGKDGWPALLKSQNITLVKGRFGYDSISLDTNSVKRTSETDLLLNFEDKKVEDLAHNYKVQSSFAQCEKNDFMGTYAALFNGKGGIRLQGTENAIFGKSGLTGSFLIGFWLNPSVVENGEILFSWRSSRTVANYPLYQMISTFFENNHLSWNFTNVFNGYTENRGEVSLQSYSTIIPNKWSYHEICFDDETGMLEYRIDGKLESICYVTTNKKERGGSVYEAQLGVVAAIEICPQYTGYLDDFRIQHGTYSESSKLLRYDIFKNEGGHFETQPVLLKKGAKINKIDALVTKPEQTDVSLFVRSGNNVYNWTDDFPKWISVENGTELENVDGFYFQLAADLYPDGGGKKSPSITQIDIFYTEYPSPLPPYKISANAGDGEVTLNWTYSVDNSVEGYLVFYGERPGEYLGQDAVQGRSPIDVGNNVSLTLTGLTNGKIYYFAVVSYTKKNDQISGDLSKEVYARPKKKN